MYATTYVTHRFPTQDHAELFAIRCMLSVSTRCNVTVDGRDALHCTPCTAPLAATIQAMDWHEVYTRMTRAYTASREPVVVPEPAC
jgi:hypothetical protein